MCVCVCVHVCALGYRWCAMRLSHSQCVSPWPSTRAQHVYGLHPAVSWCARNQAPDFDDHSCVCAPLSVVLLLPAGARGRVAQRMCRTGMSCVEARAAGMDAIHCDMHGISPGISASSACHMRTLQHHRCLHPLPSAHGCRDGASWWPGVRLTRVPD